MDNQVISPEEFYKKMQYYKDLEEKCTSVFYNKEDMHRIMDDLMCEILSSLGYENGIKVFQDAEKWYS